MSDHHEVFSFEENERSFEQFGIDNGFRYWSARRLQDFLGYKTWDSFSKVINRAMTACMTADIPVTENFVNFANDDGVPDYKLSKFACYLVSMNGDPKIPAVATAQTYFATLAQSIQEYIESAEDVQRLDLRSKMTDEEKGLSSTAKSHGVRKYGLFQDAGYRGMYNMSLATLKRRKGLSMKGRTLLDFMGTRELAANLFRISETRAKIENENIRGQRPLEGAAESVGRDVRKMMERQGGVPEELPLASDIKKVRSELRRTGKKLNKPADP